MLKPPPSPAHSKFPGTDSPLHGCSGASSLVSYIPPRPYRVPSGFPPPATSLFSVLRRRSTSHVDIKRCAATPGRTWNTVYVIVWLVRYSVHLPAFSAFDILDSSASRIPNTGSESRNGHVRSPDLALASGSARASGARGPPGSALRLVRQGQNTTLGTILLRMFP